MRIPDLKHRFCNGRTALRTILAAYLEQSATEISFHYGKHGRPSLVSAEPLLDFNLSHTGSMALLGVSTTRGIGVDIEQLRRRNNLLAIANKQLPKPQVDQLLATGEDERAMLFFQFWTLMEARLKARGGSIFDRQNAAETGESQSFLLPPDYVAAIHLGQGAIAKLRTFQLDQ